MEKRKGIKEKKRKTPEEIYKRQENTQEVQRKLAIVASDIDEEKTAGDCDCPGSLAVVAVARKKKKNGGRKGGRKGGRAKRTQERRPSISKSERRYIKAEKRASKDQLMLSNI